jgi:hypothetical protein
MRQVFLLGNDISDLIISISEININAGDYGQLTINDLPSIQGNNQRGFWDQTNEYSPFYAESQLSKFTIEIYNEGTFVYKGAIQSIQINNQEKTADITLKSDIQRKLEKGLIYASLPEANPSKMVQEICSLYKIPYDGSSFGKASEIYEADLVRTSAFFKNEGTVQDGIQQILEVGIGRVYSQNGILYYDVFKTKTVDPVFTASDNEDNAEGITLFAHPEITTSEKEPITGYNIKYVNGEAVFGDIEEQGKTIDGSYASPARISTLQAAVWIGERWMDYFSLSQQNISISVPARYGKSFLIDYPIGVEYQGKSYTVDLVSINNSLKLESKLGGLTR